MSLPDLEAIVRVAGQPAVSVTLPAYDDLGLLPTPLPLPPLPDMDLTPRQARQAQKNRIAAGAYQDLLDEPARRAVAADWVDQDSALVRQSMAEGGLIDGTDGPVDGIHGLDNSSAAGAATPSFPPAAVPAAGQVSPTESRLNAWLRARRDLAQRTEQQRAQPQPADRRNRGAQGGSR